MGLLEKFTDYRKFCEFSEFRNIILQNFGRCLCGRRSDVVRCAPLLTGVALVVVLGVTFALSPTVLALCGGGGAGGSAPAPKITKVAGPVAKSKDEIAEVKNPVVGSKEKAAVEPDERISELGTRKNSGFGADIFSESLDIGEKFTSLT